MQQIVDGLTVEVVEFDTMPDMPITGRTHGEQVYNDLLWLFRSPSAESGPTGRYAQALTDAIETGVITKPGKYGIHLDTVGTDYSIYMFNEYE